MELFWELEPGATVQQRAATLPEPTGFDPPRVLTAFLNAVRWGAITQADDKALQSPFRSGLRSTITRRMTWAMGKTIEAGLVVQELLLRHRARTGLIVCPSSLQIQRQEEMRDKFVPGVSHHRQRSLGPLAASWPQYGKPLLKALEMRMHERTQNLEITFA